MFPKKFRDIAVFHIDYNAARWNFTSFCIEDCKNSKIATFSPQFIYFDGLWKQLTAELSADLLSSDGEGIGQQWEPGCTRSPSQFALDNRSIFSVL